MPSDEPGESTSEPSMFDPLLDWNATQSELDATTQFIESLDASAKHDLEGMEQNEQNQSPSDASQRQLESQSNGSN